MTVNRSSSRSPGRGRAGPRIPQVLARDVVDVSAAGDPDGRGTARSVPPRPARGAGRGVHAQHPGGAASAVVDAATRLACLDRCSRCDELLDSRAATIRPISALRGAIVTSTWTKPPRASIARPRRRAVPPRRCNPASGRRLVLQLDRDRAGRHDVRLIARGGPPRAPARPVNASRNTWGLVRRQVDHAVGQMTSIDASPIGRCSISPEPELRRWFAHGLPGRCRGARATMVRGHVDGRSPLPLGPDLSRGDEAVEARRPGRRGRATVLAVAAGFAMGPSGLPQPRPKVLRRRGPRMSDPWCRPSAAAAVPAVLQQPRRAPGARCRVRWSRSGRGPTVRTSSGAFISDKSVGTSCPEDGRS